MIAISIDDRGRTNKPTFEEYGDIAYRIITKPFSLLPDYEVISRITLRGFPFYGCLFWQVHEEQDFSYSAQWRAQSIVGIDFDHVLMTIDDAIMQAIYLTLECELPFQFFFAYHTFSSTEETPRFRLVFKLTESFHQPRTHLEINAMLRQANEWYFENQADRNALSAVKLWQGANTGPYYVYKD